MQMARAQLFKLTMSLANILLKLYNSLNMAYMLIVLLKNVSSFSKSYSHFFSKLSVN